MSAGADVALRAARPDEFDYVFALHKEGLEAYIRRAWSWDEEAQRRDMRARFAAGGFEIAMRGGGEVGMISLSLHPDHVYLHHVIVAAAWRGQGIGTALMRIVMQRARAEGAAVRLSVFRGNPARALYARLGFRATAEDTHREWMELA